MNTTTLSDLSRAQKIALLPDAERRAFYASLTDEDVSLLEYDWDFWARPKQLPPRGHWHTWLMLAGRGWGKTDALAHWTNLKANTMPGSRGIVSAPTAGDLRDALIEGPSGICNVGHPNERPVFIASKNRLVWRNGTIALCISADEPNRFRGKQAHWAAIDELAAWRYRDAYDQLQFGLRLGDAPQQAIATTPRPIPLIVELVKKHVDNPDQVVLVKGNTYENRGNLAATYISQIITPYEGTRLGRQELHAEILTDTPGALWKRDLIEKLRVRDMPHLVRLVVAIDPATTANANSSETGIIVAGVGENGHGYVLEDLTISDSPLKWASQAITGYRKYQADRIVGEVNNGGDMVETTIRSVDPAVSFKQVRASRNKQTRAEPVSALYEQGLVHHVGMLGELEDQLCTWVPGEKSPDRLDALVWAITELMLPEEIEPEYEAVKVKATWLNDSRRR